VMRRWRMLPLLPPSASRRTRLPRRCVCCAVLRCAMLCSALLRPHCSPGLMLLLHPH
jgi:hypothetical protein